VERIEVGVDPPSLVGVRLLCNVTEVSAVIANDA
jgi:hypothetical protein